MKQWMKVLVLGLILALPLCAAAAADVAIDAKNFPDANFRELVASEFDKNGDGAFQEEELANVYTIACSGHEIASLKGIEHFTALTYLYCSNNSLSALDVTKNTALTGLYCDNNSLSALDVTNNTALTTLSCSYNSLSALDLSKNTALTELYCSNNSLISLDLSKNTALTWISCFNNSLSALDLSRNTALTMLNCGGNSLSALDLSKNTALTGFSCDDNRLEVSAPNRTFDLSGLPGFEVKKASGWEGGTVENGILTFDFGSDTARYLYDCGRGFTGVFMLTRQFQPGIAIDANNFPDANFRSYVADRFDQNGDGALREGELANAREIYCGGREISSLKGIEHFTALTSLGCPNNSLSTLVLSKNTALTDLDCSNNSLSTLDLSKNTALTTLVCSNNSLSALDVSNNTALTWLYCDGNSLSTLDVSNNTKLSSLDCNDNSLSALDLSKNTKLYSLNCSGNSLSAMNVSNNTKLYSLNCSGNSLSALDLSKNTILTWLYCGGNSLSALDLSKNTKLCSLDCSDNSLSALDLSKNTRLFSPESDSELLNCENNRVEVSAPNGKLDLSSLPGFAVKKASDWKGGTVKGSILTFNANSDTVTYRYNCGHDHIVEFRLTRHLPPAVDCILPTALKRIEGEAFAGVKAKTFLLPDGVNEIAPKAFPSGATLYYRPGTAAEAYCKKHADSLPECKVYE